MIVRDVIKRGKDDERPPARSLGFGFVALSITASCVPAHVQSPIQTANLTVNLPATLPFDETSAIGAFTEEGQAGEEAGKPGAGPPAKSFVFRAGTPVDRMRALDCLTAAVYYEAGSEAVAGQKAVAQVVLNRVRHPAYPNSVCGVVYQGPMRVGGGCQFTFTCDGSLRRRPSSAGWARARHVADAALAGEVYEPVGHSTHYHTNWVSPVWSRLLAKTAVIGSHIFYRMRGAGGQPRIFRDGYTGVEGNHATAALQNAYSPAASRPAPGAGTALASASAVTTYVTNGVRKHVGIAPNAVRDYVGGAGTLEGEELELGLPKDHNVREEFRTSGSWKADAPVTN